MKSLKQARMSKGVTKKAMAEHLGFRTYIRCL